MAKACNLICNWDSNCNPSMKDHELKLSLGLHSKKKERRKKRKDEVRDVEGSEKGEIFTANSWNSTLQLRLVLCFNYNTTQLLENGGVNLAPLIED